MPFAIKQKSCPTNFLSWCKLWKRARVSLLLVVIENRRNSISAVLNSIYTKTHTHTLKLTNKSSVEERVRARVQMVPYFCCCRNKITTTSKNTHLQGKQNQNCQEKNEHSQKITTESQRVVKTHFVLFCRRILLCNQITKKLGCPQAGTMSCRYSWDTRSLSGRCQPS